MNTLRRSLLAAAVTVAAYSLSAAQVVAVEIEFAVDMSVEIATGNFDTETQMVVVAGSFNGWNTAADTLLPDFVNPNLYTKLVQIDSVDVGEGAGKLSAFSYFYKYVTGVVGEAPAGWESVADRELVITGDEEDSDENGYLDVVQSTVPTYNNNRIEDFFAEDMTITFEVDARPAYYFLADSGFVPSDIQTNETVETWSGIFINGPLSASRTWDSWGPDLLGATATQMLHDDGTNGDGIAGDSIFTIVLDYTAGEPRKGDIKFGLDGYDNESLFGANHKLILPDAGQAGKAAGEGSIPLIFGAMEDGFGGFQDALFDPYIRVTRAGRALTVRRGGTTDPTEIGDTVNVEIEFAVDMSVEIATGNFDTETQMVVVAGSFNGWNTAADTLLPDFVNPNLYTKLVQVDSVDISEAAGKLDSFSFFYKYVTGVVGEAPAGWESVADRELVITGDEEDADGNGYLDVVQTTVPTYNNNRIEDFFAEAMTITFEVDARPAYYFLADSGFVPSDIQTNETVETWSNIFINGPLSASRTWDSWGPDLLGATPTQMLHDDGTNGDAVAGDSIFTIVLDYTPGEPRKGDIKFGLDGYDNESLFGANHKLLLPDDGQAGKTAGEATLSLIFGAMEDGQGGYQDALFDPYIQLTAQGLGEVASVVRRGAVDTAVEPIGDEIPQRIVLGDNYPNPFNPTTTFEYSISDAEHVRVLVYDLTGRLVQRLVDEVQSPSSYRVTFEAGNLSSGVYIYQLQTADRVISKKMLLLK